MGLEVSADPGGVERFGFVHAGGEGPYEVPAEEGEQAVRLSDDRPVCEE